MSIGPIVCNAVTLLAIFLASLIVGCPFGSKFSKFGSVMAGVAHTLSVVTFCAFFEIFWMLEDWRFDRVILGLIASFSVQRLVFKLLIALFLSREIGHDGTNRGWWTGNWRGRNVSRCIGTKEALLITNSLFIIHTRTNLLLHLSVRSLSLVGMVSVQYVA
jgi:1,3-beta-glucan synthase